MYSLLFLEPCTWPGRMCEAAGYGQPLYGLSRVGSTKQKYRLRCRLRYRICFREVKYAAIAHSGGPGVGRPQHTPADFGTASFEQLFPLILLVFREILLHATDSAANLPLSMPSNADFAVTLPVMLRYEADSDAMVQYLLPYEANHVAILLV